ncbi:porin [Stappia sp. F7233]|uniref:Porin n=1 Tax=Stappia albiluteola TaxID=2758565 RepID=A0A839AEU0_9HYPH|nr:porin [Stappia albiluteola]MBA5777636.1 porin [Stappia albiluteola]
MNIKSILLGAAAAAAAVSGAQAADLPAAPEPVDYVRVCDAFGTGFFYIPGTETCLRVAGRVRTEFRVRNFADDPVPGTVGFETRDQDGTTLRARGYVRLDARTNTEFGLLRNYTEIFVTQDTGGSAGLTLDRAFIQFGGLTAGRITSFFDFYTGDTFGAIQSEAFSDATTNLFGYTYSFGHGLSASASIEDGVTRRGDIYGRLGGGGVNTAADIYGGHRLPDFVANLRVDQGWGSAQVMGALHQVWNDRAASGLTVANTADSELGWAIGAGVTINLPFLAAGDTLSLQAAYADGAVKYVSPNFNVDGVLNATSTDLETSTAWGIGGGILHNWTSHWSSALVSSYGEIENDETNLVDLSQAQVAGNLVWSPVSGLIIGAELEYTHTDPDVGSSTNQLDAVFRVQRTF